jgi:hypothetical protein
LNVRPAAVLEDHRRMTPASCQATGNAVPPKFLE